MLTKNVLKYDEAVNISMYYTFLSSRRGKM